RDIRHAGTCRRRSRGARRPDRGATRQPRHDRLRRGPGRRGTRDGAARMGSHHLLARCPDRNPARAGRGRAPGRDRRRDRAQLRNHPVGRRAPHMSSEQTVIAMGVHVVDVLARPIEAIPEGQGGQLVEELRITPAGTAAGTAVTLAKLGAPVRSAGAIGTDALGDVMLELLERYGIDTSLVVRRDGIQTSASVLAIRPDGSRPAFHVIGANATYNSADAPWDDIAAASHLHLGAPEFMGGEEAAKILSFAREHGVVTSADIL